MPAPSKSKKKFSDMVDMAPEVPFLHWRLLTVVRLDRDGSGSSAGAGAAMSSVEALDKTARRRAKSHTATRPLSSPQESV